MSLFVFANSTQELPREADLAVGFTVSSPPGTDVWKRPPSTDRFTAPILHKKTPLSSFNKARVAIAANWVQLYDQGGLILVINEPDGSRKWVKTGIEFYKGLPHISTVTMDRYADWSLLPVPSGGPAATIEMVREDGGLWIYLIQGVQRIPVREVTWVFDEEKDKECWIGTYVARPSDEGGDLTVSFSHLVLDISR